MTRAAAILKSVARTTWASLPPAVQKRLNGVQVRYGRLPLSKSGNQLLGIAHKSGSYVVIDSDALEQMPEGDLEELLAHELGHIFRRRCGIEEPDDTREEAAVARLTKSWGFRPPHGSNLR